MRLASTIATKSPTGPGPICGLEEIEIADFAVGK
jgi:hypothetical protein